MRVGTCNLAGRVAGSWLITFLGDAECDVWVLTESAGRLPARRRSVQVGADDGTGRVVGGRLEPGWSWS